MATPFSGLRRDGPEGSQRKRTGASTRAAIGAFRRDVDRCDGDEVVPKWRPNRYQLRDLYAPRLECKPVRIAVVSVVRDLRHLSVVAMSQRVDTEAPLVLQGHGTDRLPASQQVALTIGPC